MSSFKMRRISNPDQYWSRKECAKWLRSVARKVESGKKDEYGFVKVSVQYATKEELEAAFARQNKRGSDNA